MAAKGGRVANIDVGNRVELAETMAGLPRKAHKSLHGTLFYQLLRLQGALGEESPAALEMFSGNGQTTCEQLIDRYN